MNERIYSVMVKWCGNRRPTSYYRALKRLGVKTKAGEVSCHGLAEAHAVAGIANGFGAPDVSLWCFVVPYRVYKIVGYTNGVVSYRRPVELGE